MNTLDDIPGFTLYTLIWKDASYIEKGLSVHFRIYMYCVRVFLNCVFNLFFKIEMKSKCMAGYDMIPNNSIYLEERAWMKI